MFSTATQVAAALVVGVLVFLGLTISVPLAFLGLGIGVFLFSIASAVRGFREQNRAIEKILQEELEDRSTGQWGRVVRVIHEQQSGWSTHWPKAHLYFLDQAIHTGASPEILRSPRRAEEDLAKMPRVRPSKAVTDCPEGHWGTHYLIGSADGGALIHRECSDCGTRWTETTGKA